MADQPSPPDLLTSEQITADGIPFDAPPAPPTPSEPSTPSTDEPAPDTSPSTQPADTSPVVETEKPEVDFTQFLDAKSIVTKEQPKPKPEPTKPEIQTTPDAKPRTERDISDLDADLAPVFKQMSNDAFNKLKPIVKEHKQLKEELTKVKTESAKQIEDLRKGLVTVPENYNEHQMAFVLTPEFNDANQSNTLAKQIFSHWEKQLIAVRGGAPEYDHLFTDAQGNYRTEKRPADTMAETTLLRYFNFAQQQQFQTENNIRQIAATHQARYTDAIGSLSNFEKTAFPLFEKPENKDKFEPLIQNTINSFNPAFRNNPLVRILAKSLFVNQQLAMLLSKAGTTTAPTNGDRTKAPPTMADVGSGDGGGSKAKGDVTMDDFQRVKAGL